jgi:hypothetical protein
VTEATGEGSLKIIVAAADAREAVARELARRLAPDQVRALDGAWVVHCAAAVDEVRDWLRAAGAGHMLFVAGFEQWSSAGQVDTAWLSRRGH